MHVCAIFIKLNMFVPREYQCALICTLCCVTVLFAVGAAIVTSRGACITESSCSVTSRDQPDGSPLYGEACEG